MKFFFIFIFYFCFSDIKSNINIDTISKVNDSIYVHVQCDINDSFKYDYYGFIHDEIVKFSVFPKIDFLFFIHKKKRVKIIELHGDYTQYFATNKKIIQKFEYTKRKSEKYYINNLEVTYSEFYGNQIITGHNFVGIMTILYDSISH